MRLGFVTLGIAALAGVGVWQVSSSQVKRRNWNIAPRRCSRWMACSSKTWIGIGSFMKIGGSHPKSGADLAARMNLEELAGLMVHGTLPAAGDELGSIGRGKSYNVAKTKQIIEKKHVNSFITRLNTDARNLFAPAVIPASRSHRRLGLS